MKSLLASMLVPVFLFLCLFSLASAESEEWLVSGDFTYRVQADGTAVLTGYTGKKEDLVIPARLNGMAVTAIGAEAFKGKTALMTVTLPETIIEIGDYAFFRCENLTYVNLPAGIREIGRNPFASCSLDCLDLAPGHPSLALEDGVLYSLPDQRLVACSVSRPKGAFTVPEGIRIIGASAFYECKTLTGLTLPDTVTSIGKKAFYQCSLLKAINLPDSISYLGDGAFNGCSSLRSLILKTASAWKS